MIVNGKRFKGLEVRKSKTTWAGDDKGAYIYVHTDCISYSPLAYDCWTTWQQGQELPSSHSLIQASVIDEMYTKPITFNKLPENVQKHLIKYLKEVT